MAAAGASGWARIGPLVVTASAPMASGRMYRRRNRRRCGIRRACDARPRSSRAHPWPAPVIRAVASRASDRVSQTKQALRAQGPSTSLMSQCPSKCHASGCACTAEASSRAVPITGRLTPLCSEYSFPARPSGPVRATAAWLTSVCPASTSQRSEAWQSWLPGHGARISR